MSDSMAKGFGEGLILGNAFAAAGSTAAAAGSIRQMGDELINLDKTVIEEKSRADKAEARVNQLEKEIEDLRKKIDVLESSNVGNVLDAYADAADLSAVDGWSKNNRIRKQAAIIGELEERLKIAEAKYIEFFARNDSKSKLIKEKISEGVLIGEEVDKKISGYVVDLAKSFPAVKDTEIYRACVKR